MKLVRILFVIGFIILVPTMQVFAQGIPSSYADASLEVSPEYPAPFDRVTLSLRSYSIPLDVRMITWIVNGVEYTRGIGMTSITLTMGAPGTEKTISAIVDASALERVTKSLTLRPNTIDLLWEAIDAYVPPFYRGKALMPPEGAVRVTALPQGSNTLTGMAFTWLRDGRVSSAESGFGRNSLTMRNNVLDQSSAIGVRVISPDGTYSAEGSISIPRSDPFIRYSLYSGSRLVARTTSDMVNAPTGEFTVVAEPFYMSSRTGTGGLNYEWNVGDVKVPLSDLVVSNELILSHPENAQIIPITTHITHQRNTSQDVTGVARIRFQ